MWDDFDDVEELVFDNPRKNRKPPRNKEWCCPECWDRDMDMMQEGWFYTSARNNPFFQGTASAGLMQLKTMCESCVEDYKNAGLWAGQK